MVAVWAALVALGTAVLPGPMPPGPVPAPVEQLRVQVLASYPHDRAAYTQGLEIHDGMLYESTGLYGQSDLRVVTPRTGTVRQRLALPDTVFAEGMTIVGGRIWQLTYREEFAFLRDRATLAEVRRVGYAGEGWGLCHDPVRRRLVMSNGRPELVLRDPTTFQVRSAVPVTLDGQPLPYINELECVDGQVWANVWLTDRIVRIDPDTGIVNAVVDAAGLLPESEQGNVDVLNGIAAVPCTDTFLITGKLWPQTFLVRFVSTVGDNIDAPARAGASGPG
ncbi:glutaminyl-peptide cyclotransferase [Plantactinospora sp. CA-294935]|uniref:glutaminyl-peptide cyclotransferase n=1 Tax=Plantactinospora sp. CA-294935 TaxID=3240012 RepID=UPI003D931C77